MSRRSFALTVGLMSVIAVLVPWLSTAVPLAHGQDSSTAVAADSILRSPRTLEAQEYVLSADDHALLEEIQYGCFRYFWDEVGDPVPLVKDRRLGPVSSIAAVGFQLSSLPIGVERGWITRQQGEERAMQVLHGLLNRTDNKHRGVYLHFPDLNTAGVSLSGYEVVASTVDHALLMAGALPAAVYFEGEVAGLVDRLIAETDWRAFAVAEGQLLSMGWRPTDPRQPEGPGDFLTYHWKDSGDEERLIYFLAAGSPVPEHALPPHRYYETQRPIKAWQDGEPFAVTYPGALFTYFFSHCWIDYRAFAADDPAAFGSDQPSIDWFENSRRAVDTHRLRCEQQASVYRTLADGRWGLSACDGPKGYIVPNLQPNLIERDDWYEGTVAPYAAGSAIMFTPETSLQALRSMRHLVDEQGQPRVWRPVAEGGYGFADAFNVDLNWTSPDNLGIDQGPLLLAIENVRTGLIWKLTRQHSMTQRAIQRLGWQPYQPAEQDPAGKSP